MVSRAEHCNVCDWILIDNGWTCIIHANWTGLDPYCDHDWERVSGKDYGDYGGQCQECDAKIHSLVGPEGRILDPGCCLGPHKSCTTAI